MFSLLLGIIYLSFISLGLPDAILGAGWTIISNEFNVSISSMGIITIIISLGTITSSLQSDRLMKYFNVGKITVFSVALTSIALLGFSISNSFLSLCFWAIPYGLGAGSVDAALNNYVAVNYESKHMSWLHCMWGIGATLGPYILGTSLSYDKSWRYGYNIIFILQLILTIVLLFTLSIWDKENNNVTENELLNINDSNVNNSSNNIMKLSEIIKIKGVPEIMIAFFCFSSFEQTAGMWASSYLVLNRGATVELGATFASLFYLGITIGRGFCGFIAMKFQDKEMITFGTFIMLFGFAILFVTNSLAGAFIGLMIAGIGSAPIYPCIIHSTPCNFGLKNSQSITGVLMASAYTGTLIMPALFGVIADIVSINLYPFYICSLVLVMITMYKKMLIAIK